MTPKSTNYTPGKRRPGNPKGLTCIRPGCTRPNAMKSYYCSCTCYDRHKREMKAAK
jgi:hypothetical protein